MIIEITIKDGTVENTRRYALSYDDAHNTDWENEVLSHIEEIQDLK